MSQKNQGGNNKPRRVNRTSTSKGTNPLNIGRQPFNRGLGLQKTTDQGMSVSYSNRLSESSSKNLLRNSSSGEELPIPSTLSSLPSSISSISSLSSSSSLNIPPTDITTQIKTDRKNVVNAIQNNRKIEESVIYFDEKKFSVKDSSLIFEKEDGIYQIKFPEGYAEVGNQIYLGKDNGKYYIGIKRMPYNTIVDRENEELNQSKLDINKLNETVQEIFNQQSYNSKNKEK